ncbi:DNA breaking-rejoining protein, partial [Salmonella enterica subsp. enterica serovar Enteritidis]|nr:DNA breaking-rejoining protein [Salmonella enterica subsp. enterica serovar Enteritidis]
MANCPNDNGKLMGRNIVVEVADGCPDVRPEEAEWKALAACTSKTLDLAPNTTNSEADDTKGWVENLLTTADATISIEGEVGKNDKLDQYGIGRFTK